MTPPTSALLVGLAASTPAPPRSVAATVLQELAAQAVSLHAASGGDLLWCFESVPDPREPTFVGEHPDDVYGDGAVRVHHLAGITAWIGPADHRALAALGCRRNALGILTGCL